MRLFEDGFFAADFSFSGWPCGAQSWRYWLYLRLFFENWISCHFIHILLEFPCVIKTCWSLNLFFKINRFIGQSILCPVNFFYCPISVIKFVNLFFRWYTWYLLCHIILLNFMLLSFFTYFFYLFWFFY